MHARGSAFAALAAAVMLLTLATTESSATVIVKNDAGGFDLIIDTYLGQSVTTPAGDDWNNILFSFLDLDTSVADGTLYLLSGEYVGAPADLGAAAGLIATSTGISGGKYLFDPSVVLLASTTYYFYADAQFTSGTVTGDGDVYSGGIHYANWPDGGTATDPFSPRPSEDVDFLLEGTAIPEPTTLLLIAVGIVGLGVTTRHSATA